MGNTLHRKSSRPNHNANVFMEILVMSSKSENIASHYLHMSMENFAVAAHCLDQVKEESEEFGGIKIAVCIFSWT